ncbi:MULTISPECIES: HutD family protein [unclassified Mesorhizobium]|uniref:HutD/Ves family protein n=1 Tax=unclassified Mesorhizobium TaxID=325217 RepID=UPI000FD5C56E|nr:MULTISPECIES: HutD family protein [unclassified Mesorhizobium]RUW99004.1 HutD family protein [Mesorhizobium sp. M8A.F.Ca.ET.023.01.1.1]RWC73847.1 MAG: HutD family protein [Mesorhizobium sp.]TGV09920.1 HutD family protein [Mesorhizobium sp. M8A.F.Ca.ET.173.01.1.1]TGT89977.1 HutD family protein [Mesorhizobium sp. M8A.F.Ca.ET.161.01.1.1]TGV42534.1 HutD family protein [Mesorhizobium sp. M8A.F.Ca.ET.142.01.1.1]
MRILRAADYRVMPWKNGGGTTTEIAVSPDGAGLDDFDWRVSMARVEGSGPFSSFAGIDRTLSVLEGEGIVLDVAGRPPERMTAASQPFSFPADQPTRAALIAGPITDLNVMTRRGRMLHQVERLAISTPVEIPTEAGPTLILCHRGHAIFPGAAPIRLGPLDTLLPGPDASVLRVQPAPDATLFVIRIIAAA